MKKANNYCSNLVPKIRNGYFNYVEPGENPNYPEGKKDNTHFNELGARKIAEIVLAEIKNLHLELANRIYKPAVKK